MVKTFDPSLEAAPGWFNRPASCSWLNKSGTCTWETNVSATSWLVRQVVHLAASRGGVEEEPVAIPRDGKRDGVRLAIWGNARQHAKLAVVDHFKAKSGPFHGLFGAFFLQVIKA